MVKFSMIPQSSRGSGRRLFAMLRTRAFPAAFFCIVRFTLDVRANTQSRNVLLMRRAERCRMATGDKVFLRFVTRAHALSTGEPRTKPVFNVWDFKRTNTGGTPSKSQAFTAFDAAIMTPLRACLSVSYVGDFRDIRWLDDPLDPYNTVPLTTPGGVAGDSVPSLNNVYAKLGSGLRGGSNRGAKHFGPIAEASTLLDELNSGEVTLFGTFVTAYLAGFTAADGFSYLPFIVSQTKSVFNSTTANVVGVTCTSVTVNTILGRVTRRAQFRRSSV
jgi:hypothetical protein